MAIKPKTKGGMGSKQRATGTTKSKVKAKIPDRVGAWTAKLPFIRPAKPERAGKSKYKETANAILETIARGTFWSGTKEYKASKKKP
jgi:hypothetical protein